MGSLGKLQFILHLPPGIVGSGNFRAAAVCRYDSKYKSSSGRPKYCAYSQDVAKVTFTKAIVINNKGIQLKGSNEQSPGVKNTNKESSLKTIKNKQL